MSEELLQVASHPIGRYQFYKLGASTLTQLKRAKIVNGKFSKDIANKKPDGLIVLPGGDVKVVIEYKQPSELSSKKKIEAAIAQELEVARQLCNVLIVTDSKKSFWINALNGERIQTENGQELKKIFDAKHIVENKLSSEQLLELESLIDKIDHSVTESNNTIALPAVLDPSALAKTIWQKIWVNTGKEPEKCLYNVVELFVFKFLSDVGVLKAHNNFRWVYDIMQKNSPKEALKSYALTCRREIRELFPKGDDGTTVINGTIFVNEKGEPNLSQAHLFGEVLKHLQDYDSDYGSFKYIQKEFKTRLYESFLRQEAGIRFLGQYFTPRNVVKAMVSMSNAKSLTKGARICDPFCGVGGFILEVIAENKHIWKEFEPRNGEVKPGITLLGYDKGTDEKEDERTIILAKANMLIYFSDLLVKYHTADYLKSFSDGAFNKVFHLLRSNLGTFGLVKEEPFDLILTNPPYVTSGSSSLKKAIEDEGLSNDYTAGGRGTESLALEWIIRNLKEGGQTLLVVPDGLLNQTNMLSFIKEKCIVQGIISLPTRTFYSTPKKTYILILERKHQYDGAQETPVSTYLVSEVGETRDAKRFRIEQNDLDSATSLFNQYAGSPNTFISKDSKCKITNFDAFDEKANWMVDRWWSEEEKIALGVIEEQSNISTEEFIDLIKASSKGLEAILSETFSKQKSISSLPYEKMVEVPLKDKEYFSLSIGNRVLKKDIFDTGIPVYSANVTKPFGYIKKSNIKDFSKPALLWGIDGIFDWNYIPEGNVFAATDHCGTLYVEHPDLLPKYVYYALKASKDQYGFDRTYRASLSNLKNAVSIEVPVKKDGSFDIKAQQRIADKYEKMEKAKEAVLEQLEMLTSVQVVI